jgi:polysaccharide pyruvyl transferase WcaK-like protein
MTAVAPLPSTPRTRTGRVFLAGAFGQGNPGDEALLAAFAQGIGDHRAVVASADPAATTAAHGLDAVGRDDLGRVAREIRRAESVCVAGGTIFKSLHPSCGRPPLALLRRTAALAAVTRALRKPLALVGVGAAPLHGASARGLARGIVRAADLLILRDDESAGHLAAVGAPTPIRVGADPAWILLPDPEADRAALMRSASGLHAAVELDAGVDRGPVVVALSHLAGDRGHGEQLAAGLQPIVDAGIPVRLDPWQVDGDAELAADVAARLGGGLDSAAATGADGTSPGGGVVIGAPPTDLRAARDGMTGARLVIAQRFHALVAAASAGVPVLAVAHEPKLSGLARRLGQPTVAPDAPPQSFAGAVLGALDAAPAPATTVRRERAAAEDGFRLLRVLLARGRSDEAADVEGLALRPEEWVG